MKKAARTKGDCCQKNTKPQMQKSQCAARTDEARCTGRRSVLRWLMQRTGKTKEELSIIYNV